MILIYLFIYQVQILDDWATGQPWGAACLAVSSAAAAARAAALPLASFRGATLRALEEVAEGVLAEEVPAEKVPAEEVPGSSRSTTHGVPVSSEAVTGGGSRVASGAEVR